MSVGFLTLMFLVGCGVGLLNAALGIGGGILMVPALREAIPGIDPHTAKGTSLFIIIFVAGLNAWRQNRGHKIPWRLAAFLAAGSILGGYSGAWFTGYLSGKAVTWIFIVLLGLMTIRLLFSKPQPATVAAKPRGHGIAFLIGILTGLASGMTGIGGGLVLVSLVLLAGLSANERITALSNLVMIATAAAGAWVHLRAPRTLDMVGTIGQVNLAVVPALFLGAQLGSPFGQWFNARLAYSKRKIALATLNCIIAIRLIGQALD